MPYKDRETQLQYWRDYRQKNKDKKRIQDAEYRIAHLEEKVVTREEHHVADFPHVIKCYSDGHVVVGCTQLTQMQVARIEGILAAHLKNLK